MKVPFIDLSREANLLFEELKYETEQVLKSGQYINGPKVKEFEEKFSNYCNVKHTVSLGNGSDGLTFILKSLKIGEGDTVICPANSFIASAWSIIASGAKPIFCDVGEDMLISIKDIEKVILPSTKAIMGVHLTGRLCDNESISKYCKEKNIYFIEDAAQAFGAKDQNGNTSGSFGIAASFSLHPLKNLAIYGDGGIITTNDDSVFEMVSLLRNHGLVNRDECIEFAYNSRLDTIQAVVARHLLNKIDSITSFRIKNAHYFDRYLSEIEQIKLPARSDDLFEVFDFFSSL